MLRKTPVPIPEIRGKIYLVKARNGIDVFVHYEYGRTYIKEKKYVKTHRKMIGKVCPDNPAMMWPNDNYFVFFPDEAEALVPIVDDSSRHHYIKCGSFILTSWILEDYGLKSWMQEHFGSLDGGLLLDLASYMVVDESNVAQHYPAWAWERPLYSPDMHIYSDTKVARVLKHVDRDDVSGFIHWWNRDAKKKKDIVYLSYDSTNKACQAGDIDLIEFGKAKVDLGQPIFNVTILYDIDANKPLAYEVYQGSIVDISQLKYMLEKLYGLGYRNIGIILDRGYFSKENINDMDDKGYSFVIMLKGCKNLVASLVMSVRGTFEDSEKCWNKRYSMYGTTVEQKLYADDKKNRYFHIFYSPARAAAEQASFRIDLEKCEKVLENLKRTKSVKFKINEDGGKYKYFDIEYGPRGNVVMYSPRNADIEAYIKLCGYFCIVSSDRMDALKALEIYKSRDGSEKAFSWDKTFFGNNSMRSHTEEGLRGRTFISFIALIIRCRIAKLIRDFVEADPAVRRKSYFSVPALIRELDMIVLLRTSSGKWTLECSISARQKELFKMIGMDEKMVMTKLNILAHEMERLVQISDESLVSDNEDFYSEEDEVI